MLTTRERNILVATRIALILGILSFILLTILVTAFGPNVNTPIIAAIGLFFFLIAYANRRGFFNPGRILLCVIPPVITLMAAVLAKVQGEKFTDILYYDSRFFLLLFAIVPCLIFDTTEKWRLYGCLAFMLLPLILFDPVHEFFGVGYFQLGFASTSYYYINWVAVMVFIGIAAGCISLKVIIERAETQNETYRTELMGTNTRLSEALNDLESRNQEITAQSEELMSSQDQLIDANKIIEKQKVELQKQVKQINSDLQEANEELVKHNNELQQFSYSISHHLRGPIARLLGLTNLAKVLGNFRNDEEATVILNHIETSAVELDLVIRDLSSVVELRNSLYQLRQTVDFLQEWTEIRRLLNITDEEEKAYRVDFSQAPTVYSVRPMIHSILINLVSNAIKFRSMDRPLRVDIKTHGEAPYTVLSISDNGLGIDLNVFQKEIFKMYKRFHQHQEGKGLGLYLIKTQVELLSGHVEVESTPGRGSKFKVFIKNAAPRDSTHHPYKNL
jgi:signal transduction histidine kinase